MGEQYEDFLKREVSRLTAEIEALKASEEELNRQAIYHNKKHGEAVTAIREILESPIIGFTLVDRDTGEQWKHSKRLVYDTLAGLKQGYSSCRWTKLYDGWTRKPPPFPGPFEVVELRAVIPTDRNKEYLK